VKQRRRSLKTEEMTFTEHAQGYISLDHRTSEHILEELRVDAAEKKSIQYKRKWLNYIIRM